jgi:imidazolonepropionase-like amidohydrolase
VVAGPRNFFLDGRDRRINGVAAKWWEGGLRTVATETDSPVTPIEEHSYQAAVACHYGWEPYAALKGLTLVTAKGGMVEDRVGSIEKGKDGDLGIWTGDPVDPRSVCTMTIVNGRVVYDMKKEGQRY